MAAATFDPAVLASGQSVFVSAEQLGIGVQGEDYAGHVQYDLGNLAAFDTSPIDPDRLNSARDATCHELATKVTQCLINKIFALPSEAADVGRIAHLPAPTTPLPRAKPLPKPREPTRWEKFAQQKGMQKRKRSKLVYDEAAGEWRRRFGYKRANDDKEIPIIDAATEDEVGMDPFTQLRQEKRDRVKGQAKRQLANLKATAKAGGHAALPPTLKLAAALPEHGRGAPGKRKHLKDDIKAASRQAGVSTASMGKFDRRAAGEAPGARTPAGKRRKFLPVAGGNVEAGAITGVVDRIIREQADDVVDVGKAISKFEHEAREGRRVLKAAGGGAAGKGKRAGGGMGGAGRTGKGGKPGVGGSGEKSKGGPKVRKGQHAPKAKLGAHNGRAPGGKGGKRR